MSHDRQFEYFATQQQHQDLCNNESQNKIKKIEGEKVPARRIVASAAVNVDAATLIYSISFDNVREKIMYYSESR